MDKAEFPDKEKPFFTPVLGAGTVSVMWASSGGAGILKETSGLRSWTNTELGYVSSTSKAHI